MLHFFNYSVKKLWNLESSFSIIDNSWKNKTPITSTKTFRMVINLSKNCLQSQSFFIVWNQKQMLFVFGKHDQGKQSYLTSKGLIKLLPSTQKLYQITYIFSNTLRSVSIKPFYTNWLAPRGTLGLECICRAQVIIQTTHLHCRLPYNYVTSLLAYCRG